jgi:DNA-binding transcriptional MerR regulator
LINQDLITDPKKLYRTGEITHFTGISRQTLHLYSQIGLIQEAKRSHSGQRLFDERVFSDLKKIKRFQDGKLTLVQIKKKLRDDSQLKFDFSV